MKTLRKLRLIGLTAIALATAASQQPARADPHDFPGWTGDMHAACVHDSKCQAQMSQCYHGSAFYSAVNNICQGWPNNQYCSVTVLQWCDVQLYNKCIVNKGC